MKSEVKINDRTDVLKFPFLKQSQTGNVFLCIDEKTTICLNTRGGGGFKIGTISTSIDYNRLDTFNGELILSN